MIACPICGGDTQVTETRDSPSGARRRRRCRSSVCDGLVTTLEVVMDVPDRCAGGLALVPRSKLKAIADLIASFMPRLAVSSEQSSCVSPEDRAIPVTHADAAD